VIAKDYAWVVFDNLRNIGRINLRFNFRGEENILVSEKGESEEASQFEVCTAELTSSHRLP
jgi:hypothetical protein